VSTATQLHVRHFNECNEGYGTSVAPTYINEVSPRHLRGTLGVAFQFGVVVTLFFSQLISLQPALGSEDKWNYALGTVPFTLADRHASSVIGLPIAFSIMQVILLFFVPETPNYLLLKSKDTTEAEIGESSSERIQKSRDSLGRIR
jgi:MFS transporter, SP family, solute carrier family 2 (facilitated glucose transporter), member 9